MVKLEEVMDEEFVREQEGPHDEDEWDTDSGMHQPTITHTLISLTTRLEPQNAQKLTHTRVRPRIRIRIHPRRDSLRAHQRTERHRSRIHTSQHQRQVRDAFFLDEERVAVWRQDAVGRVDIGAAAGCPVGAGVLRGADDCGAGEGGDDGAEGAE